MVRHALLKDGALTLVFMVVEHAAVGGSADSNMVEDEQARKIED